MASTSSASAPAAGLIRESFFVFNSLESLLVSNTDDMPRIQAELEKLLRLMTPSDSGTAAHGLCTSLSFVLGMFFVFLLRLFDRVFGEDTTGFKAETPGGLPTSSSTPQTAVAPTQGRGWVVGGKGGWLASGGGQLNRSTTALVEMLSPQSKVIQMLTAKADPTLSGVSRSFEMSLSVFPRRMQMRFTKNVFNDFTNALVSYNYESKFKSIKSLSTNQVLSLMEGDLEHVLITHRIPYSH